MIKTNQIPDPLDKFGNQETAVLTIEGNIQVSQDTQKNPIITKEDPQINTRAQNDLKVIKRNFFLLQEINVTMPTIANIKDSAIMIEIITKTKTDTDIHEVVLKRNLEIETIINMTVEETTTNYPDLVRFKDLALRKDLDIMRRIGTIMSERESTTTTTNIITRGIQITDDHY